MKILATADIHIWDYPQYSTINEQGVPSRLTMYEYLAKDIASIAEDNHVNLIVMAGDILHGAVPKPMVLNTARNFFQILTDSCNSDIFVIPGQHDLDVKSCSSHHEMHTALSSIMTDATYLFTTPTLTDSYGCKVYIEPWMPDGISTKLLS